MSAENLRKKNLYENFLCFEQYKSFELAVTSIEMKQPEFLVSLTDYNVILLQHTTSVVVCYIR